MIVYDRSTRSFSTFLTPAAVKAMEDKEIREQHQINESYRKDPNKFRKSQLRGGTLGLGAATALAGAAIGAGVGHDHGATGKGALIGAIGGGAVGAAGGYYLAKKNVKDRARLAGMGKKEFENEVRARLAQAEYERHVMNDHRR